MGSAASRASLPTILIVEDEFLARAMLSDHLQECGFMVFEAPSADEAIKIIETRVAIRRSNAWINERVWPRKMDR